MNGSIYTHLLCLHIHKYSFANNHSSYVYVYSWCGRGVIDVPIQKVAEFLKRTENNITWDKYLVVSVTSLTLEYNVLYTVSSIG